MNKMKKSMVAAGLTAGLIGGGAAGAILGSAGVSGAQETTTTEAPAAEAPAPAAPGEAGERPDPSARITEALAPLVEDGTLTQEQADKVAATLAESLPGRGGPGGGPGRGHGGPGGGPGLDAAATALGISVEELRTALSEGQSIAQVAETEGVDVQVVVDALVADRAAKLAEKVTAGELTQEEADAKLAEATERITERIEQVRPERGEEPPAPEADPGD